MINKSRILIVNPPFYRFQESTLVHYPQGPAFVAAALEKAGHKPLIYNADYDPTKKSILGNTNHINVGSLTRKTEEYQRRLHSEDDPIWREIREYIAGYKPNLLFVSVFNTTATASLRVARIAKDLFPGIPVAFESLVNRGLHSAIDCTNLLDAKELDFAIRRDPEETSVELVKALESGTTDFSDIRGLSWKKDGRIVRNADRPPLESLDDLPFPARHLIDGYEEMPPHTFQGILGGRGCPFECTFCGVPNSGGARPRFRSAKSMVDEMEHVYHKHGTRYFYMCEDIFFLKRSRTHEFCELLIERKLPLYWSAQTRAEMVDKKTLELARRAGAQHIAIGVESGNQRSREIMKKENTVDDVRNAAKMIHESGLRMVAFVIVGLPWEGPAEVRDTVNLVKEIKPYIVYPYLPTPVKGTEMADVMLQDTPDGWSEARDACHMDIKALQANGVDPEEKQKAVQQAIDELVTLNKGNLIRDVAKRPGFYWALANDMNFLRKPGHLLSYVKDYVSK